jgi:hypothetical protein
VVIYYQVLDSNYMVQLTVFSPKYFSVYPKFKSETANVKNHISYAEIQAADLPVCRGLCALPFEWQ